MLNHRYPKTSTANISSPWASNTQPSTSKADDDDVVEWLQDKGFAVEDILEERGGVPPGAAVHLAAYEGSVRLCKWLSKHGADLSQRTQAEGCTPMHYAFWGGSLNVAVFLYKHGCGEDLAVRSSSGQVPADYATELGHARLLRWVNELASGTDWGPLVPGQVITEKALCPSAESMPPPPREDTSEETNAREKLEEKKRRMEEAGLDSETFQGFK